MSATIHSFPSSIQQRSYLFWKFFCAVIGDKAASVVVREATDRTPMSPSARYCFIENLHRSGLMADAEYAVLEQWFQWITSNVDVRPDLIGESVPLDWSVDWSTEPAVRGRTSECLWYW